MGVIKPLIHGRGGGGGLPYISYMRRCEGLELDLRRLPKLRCILGIAAQQQSVVIPTIRFC